MHPPFNSLSQPNAYGNMTSSVPSKKVDLLLFKFVKCVRTTFDAPASLAVDDFFFHVTFALKFIWNICFILSPTDEL